MKFDPSHLSSEMILRGDTTPEHLARAGKPSLYKSIPKKPLRSIGGGASFNGGRTASRGGRNA